jgi:ribosome-associated protein
MGEFAEVFERLFSRMGARAFSEYGVAGILGVVLAFFVLLFIFKFAGYAISQREELKAWLRKLGSIVRITDAHVKSEAIHSLICAGVLLIAAIGQWPYFIYVLLRVFICGSSAYIASRLRSQHRVVLTWVAGAIALLYNPIFPVRMARSDWAAINVFTAVAFIAFAGYRTWENRPKTLALRLQQHVSPSQPKRAQIVEERVRLPLHPTSILVQVAAAVCEENGGEDTRILALDPTDSSLSDFFVVTSAPNYQIGTAITHDVESRLKKEFGVSPVFIEGRNVGEWILLDYVNFTVHIFQKDRRAFYDIEKLRKSARSFTPAQFNRQMNKGSKAQVENPPDTMVPTPSRKKAAAIKKPAKDQL